MVTDIVLGKAEQWVRYFLHKQWRAGFRSPTQETLSLLCVPVTPPMAWGNRQLPRNSVVRESNSKSEGQWDLVSKNEVASHWRSKLSHSQLQPSTRGCTGKCTQTHTHRWRLNRSDIPHLINHFQRQKDEVRLRMSLEIWQPWRWVVSTRIMIQAVQFLGDETLCVGEVKSGSTELSFYVGTLPCPLHHCLSCQRGFIINGISQT